MPQSKLIGSAAVLLVKSVVAAANYYRDARGFHYKKFYRDARSGAPCGKSAAGRLARLLRMAPVMNPDRRRLRRIAAAGREGVLAHHTPVAIARHVAAHTLQHAQCS